MTASASKRTIATLGCVVILYTIRLVTSFESLTVKENDILFVIMATLLTWIIRPAPYSIIGILMLIAFWSVGLDSTLIFSGFSDDGFFFFFGVLLLSRVIIGVNLHLAIANTVMSRIKNIWQLVLATPFVLLLMALPVPSATARSLALKPIFNSVVDSDSMAGTHVMLSLGAINRIGGRAYLSGGLAAILTVSVLDQYGYSMTWSGWLLYMWPPALLLVTLSTLGITIFYNNGLNEVTSAASVNVSDSDLGFDEPFFNRGRTLVLALLVFIIAAWIGASFVGVPEFIPLLLLLSLTFFSPLDIADEKTLSGLNWDLLLFFGTALSMPAVLAETDISEFLVEDILGSIITPTLGFPMFLLSLICVLVILRIVLIGATYIIVALPLVIQLAAAMGHDPLVVTFVSLFAGSVVFFPIQTPATMVAFQGHYLTQRDTILAGFTMLAAVFVTTFVSVYLYWPLL